MRNPSLGTTAHQPAVAPADPPQHRIATTASADGGQDPMHQLATPAAPPEAAAAPAAPPPGPPAQHRPEGWQYPMHQLAAPAAAPEAATAPPPRRRPRQRTAIGMVADTPCTNSPMRPPGLTRRVIVSSSTKRDARETACASARAGGKARCSVSTTCPVTGRDSPGPGQRHQDHAREAVARPALPTVSPRAQ